MSQNFEFDDLTSGLEYAGLDCAPSGCVAARQRMTFEDVLYRVATVTAVAFLLATIL